MLSENEISEIKRQLVEQIENNFPEDKKQTAKEHILSMDAKELEGFLIKNNLMKGVQGEENISEKQNIFRMIVSEKIPSYKIEENSHAIAVLEINPVSKGHTIIIPKNPVNSASKIPPKVFSLAKKVSKKIKTKLKSNDVNISTSNLFGEFIINVIPVYDGDSEDSKRHKAEKEELEELQNQLGKKEKAEKIPQPKIKKPAEKAPVKIKKEEIIYRLPRRIP